MIGFPKWLLFGICSAAIGGAIWVAIAHFAGAEVGYVAWGIGFLAGVGVRFAAGDENEGFLPGAAGVISAVAVVLFSKYMVVSLAVNAALAGMDLQGQVPDYANDRGAAISRYADTLLQARNPDDPGADLDWPPGMTYEDARRPEHYPPAIRQEATDGWDGLDEPARQAFVREWSVVPEVDADALKLQVFKQNFSPWDLLWFGLAAFTAFGLGSGTAGGDD